MGNFDWYGSNNADYYKASKGEKLLGNGGNDRLFGETVFGGDGNDTVSGLDEGDFLKGNNGNDHLYGFDGSDRLDGGEGDDLLTGNSGNDLLVGGDGNDALQAGSGRDTLFGGDGNDRFYAGVVREKDSVERDSFYGGSGADTFDLTTFNSYTIEGASAFPDVSIIKDFNSEEGDRLVIYGSVSYEPSGNNVLVTTTLGEEDYLVAVLENARHLF